MTNHDPESHIIDNLLTIDTLLKCLDKEQRQKPRNLLLKGSIEFYKDEDMEKFSIVMLDMITQVSVELINKVKEEIEKE